MKTLLIDADIYAASIIARQYKEQKDICLLLDSYNNTEEIKLSEKVIKDWFNYMVERLCLDLQVKNYKLFFSCKREHNWKRHLVSEQYKANREKQKLSPIFYKYLDKLKEQIKTYISYPFLEADDLIGIFATHKNYINQSIVCSWDSDFETLPCTLYNSRKKTLKQINKLAAFKKLIIKVMAGDSADNYKGIKGIGKKRAQEFITTMENKLEKDVYKLWVPLLELAYEKGSHSEDYMTDQLRLAYILRHDDFDFDYDRINLIKPTDLRKLL